MINEITTYQNNAIRTLPRLGHKDKDLFHMGLGVKTEMGEILDIFKKNIAYNKEIDLVNLSEEFGDMMWYVANTCNILGAQLDVDSDSCTPFSIASLDPSIYRLDRYCNTLFEFTLINVESQTRRSDIDNAYYFSMIIDTCNIIYHVIKHLCKDYGFDFNNVLDTNIKKLKLRYPDNFSNEKALNRNINKERDLLNSQKL